MSWSKTILRIYKDINGYCKGQLKLAYIVFLIKYPHNLPSQSSMKCLFIAATKCNISIYLLSDVIYRPHILFWVSIFSLQFQIKTSFMNCQFWKRLPPFINYDLKKKLKEKNCITIIFKMYRRPKYQKMKI